MKKTILAIGLCLLLTGTASHAGICCKNEDAAISQDKCDELVKRMYDCRSTLYNVLNLTPCQEKQREEIEKNRFVEIDIKFHQLTQEKYVLKKLEQGNASETAIKEQKNIVCDLEKEIKKSNKKYDDDFYCLLTCQQKTKFKEIRKMAEKDIKYCKKNKKLYKQDPNLRPFGQKVNYDECDCSKTKKRCNCGCK